MTGTSISQELVKSLKPLRSDSGNKGTFGKLLIVAGSRYMSGAAVLSVSSALRTGVGLTELMSDEKSLDAIRANCPCALTAPVDGNYLKSANDILKRCSAVLIGPGLDTKDPRNQSLLEFMIENAPKLVIDASALTLLSKDPALLGLSKRQERGLSPAILTPHVGEFRRFGFGSLNYEDFESGRLQEALSGFCKEHNVITVLKNHTTFINTCGKECYYIVGDNSGLAKGGSGDILSGLIAGYAASGFEPSGAAIAGVFVHSAAGKLAADRLTKLFMQPSDILGFIPDIYKGLGW